MKRKEDHNSKHAHLRPVRLYREQLEEIIDVLQTAKLDVTISDREFTFSDLDDLKDNRGSPLTDLTITGNAPDTLSWNQLSVEFSKGAKTTVFLSSGTEDSLNACWYKVRDILTDRYRWHQRVLNKWIAWFVFCLCAGMSGTTTIVPEHVQQLYVAILIGAFLYLLTAFYWNHTYPVILLDRQHEVSSFWTRNGDKIIIMVIGAVLGSVITLGVKNLFER